MKIDLYTRCWNDADMLGFFFRHYDRFVQRYFIYDDGSTDSSLDILSAHPCVEIRPMPEYSDPDSRVLSNLALQQEFWKESRGAADWVIVTDIDEHIYHRDIKNYLVAIKSQGVTVVPLLGFSMLSDEFPRTDSLLCETMTLGAPRLSDCKMSMFSPDDIEEVHFAPGRHDANPSGNVVIPAVVEVFMLHYKFMGFERVVNRHALFLSRQRQKDIEYGLGAHYSFSQEQLQELWNHQKRELIDVAKPGLQFAELFEPVLWWQKFQRAAPLEISFK